MGTPKEKQSPSRWSGRLDCVRVGAQVVESYGGHDRATILEWELKQANHVEAESPVPLANRDTIETR